MQLSNKITNNGCHRLRGDAAYSSKTVPTFQRILVPQLATVTKFQYLSSRLHNITSQKAAEFTATAVRIPNETNIIWIAMCVCVCVCVCVCLSISQSNQSLFILCAKLVAKDMSITCMFSSLCTLYLFKVLWGIFCLSKQTYNQKV